MAFTCTAVHNPNRTPEDDRLTRLRVREIYRQFYERHPEKLKEMQEAAKAKEK